MEVEIDCKCPHDNYQELSSITFLALQSDYECIENPVHLVNPVKKMPIMKKIKSIKNTLIFIYHAIRLLLIPSKSLYSLLFVGNKLSESKVAQQATTKLLQEEEIQEQVQANYGYKVLDLDELKDMPEGSFGKVLYGFMTSQNLDVYPLLENIEPSPEVYLRERRRKIHDYLHVILRYGTDLLGESEVNAFTARQTGMPISYLIIIGVLLRTMLKQPLEFHSLIDRLKHAWERGSISENLFVYPWEDLFEQPLEEVRLGFFIQQEQHVF